MSKTSKHIDNVAAAVIEGDGKVVEAMEPLAGTPLMKAVGFLSEVGDQPPMRAICVGTMAAGAVMGSPRMMRAGARMLAAHSLATWAKNFVKLRVDRTRPREDRDHMPRPGRSTEKEVTSFPSGHTAGAVAVARAFARDFPEHRTAAYLAAGAISLVQVPRCAHYPTDIGAGAAIGLAAEAGLAAITGAAASQLDDVGDVPVFDTGAARA